MHPTMMVLENLNQLKDVIVLRARVHHFCNWDKFFDQCMNKTEKAKANHIFACTALEPFALQVQEHWEVPITKQNTVKKHSVAADWGNPSNKPEETQGRQGEKEATGSIKRPLD